MPFPIDFRDGRAFVSVVAFDIQHATAARRPMGEYLLKPIGNHGFLNVRTYVRHRASPGFIFWLNGFGTGWRCISGPEPSAA